MTATTPSVFAIDAKTRLCALLGNPVEHSMSPAIHNAAFRERSLNYVYLAFRVEKVKEAIDGIRGLGLAGLSVTIPHKVAVIPFLDEVEPIAQGIGAVNTIVVDESGKLIGTNTDGLGALKALQEAQTPLDDAPVVLIGSGGAARAIAFTLICQAPIRSLTICGIEPDQIAKLAGELNALNRAPVRTLSMEDTALAALLEEARVLINTSPIGMSPNIDACPIPSSLLHSELTVFDVVYNPLKTRLLREAENKGCRIVPGVEMFIQQAVAQFELWTGQSAPVAIMRRVVLDRLKG